jgi:murein DD-endopeptidase MepM/ murein hydrolase activator NlpD
MLYIGIFVLLFVFSSIPAGVLDASSSSSDPIEAFEAAKNIDPQSASGTGPLSKMLVLDDSALSVVHGPLLDGTNTDNSAYSPENDQIQLYTVRSGDTVYDIARMFNVSVNTILWANDMSLKTPLKVGQIIAVLPVNGIKYTVKNGDTISSLAKKFNARAEDIVNYNNINTDNNQLAVGDEIIIPDGEIAVDTVSNTNKNGNVVNNDAKSDTKWIPPLINGLISGYFIRPVPNGTKSQGVHPHNGVDIAAPLGSPILAAADGNVIFARVGGWGGGYGSYIIIQHPNGMQTLYAHMSKVFVTVGDHVSQGQIIGNVGSTGHSTGPHLHIEVHMKGGSNPVNRFY